MLTPGIVVTPTSLLGGVVASMHCMLAPASSDREAVPTEVKAHAHLLSFVLIRATI